MSLSISSAMKLSLSPRGNPFAAYTANGYAPAVVLDWSQNKAKGVQFSDLVHTRASNATQIASDGTVQWAPHNLALNSATPATQSITVVSGADYTVEMTGSGSITLSGAGTGSVTEGSPVEITASTTSLTLTIVGSVDTMWAYRSDLGGMANNPATGNTYVPTTSAAVYLPRRENHIHSGGQWVKRGLIEPAATNLLLNSNTLSTQGVTVTAQAYTLHFTGTGTITLSGASTAGPLVGTGTGENNRVSLTFTPSAGTLTLTVSGTVTNAQLETGLVPTSYIPTFGSTAARAADTYHIPAANLAGTVTTQGAELVTNGGFDTDATGWTSGSGGVLSATGGQLSVMAEAPDAFGNAYQAVAVEIGKTYLVRATKVSQTENGPWGVSTTITGVRDILNFGDGIDGHAAGFFTASGTTVYIQLGALGSGASDATAIYDNVSVTEITMPAAVSIAVKGEASFGDEGAAAQFAFVNWAVDGSNYISLDMDTDGAATGEVNFNQAEAGTVDSVASASGAYTPGVNVPFSIASAHSASRINGAVDGTALTENTTVTALADLTTADFEIAPTGTINLERLLIWAVDVDDQGLIDTTND